MAQQYGRFRALINTGKSREEIMAAMQISIATYYRYQKMYQELEGAEQSITGTQTMGQFRIMQWVQKNYGNRVNVKFSGRNAATLYEKQGGQLQVQYDPEKKEIIIKKVKSFEIYKVSAKYCYVTHELRLHQNDRCKRFTLF